MTFDHKTRCFRGVCDECHGDFYIHLDNIEADEPYAEKCRICRNKDRTIGADLRLMLLTPLIISFGRFQ